MFIGIERPCHLHARCEVTRQTLGHTISMSTYAVNKALGFQMNINTFIIKYIQAVDVWKFKFAVGPRLAVNFLFLSLLY